MTVEGEPAQHHPPRFRRVQPTHGTPHDSGGGMMPSLRESLQANLLADMTGRGPIRATTQPDSQALGRDLSVDLTHVRKYTSTRVSDKQAG